ncbi:transposase [Erwinia tracheiphila PSU-1]|nr:transposase [Erwinia tracheiphila PSU-1]
MRTRWMWNVRQFLLRAWSEDIALPSSLMHITTGAQWQQLILTAGGKCWCVYMSKKTSGGKNTVKYPGRYLKKAADGWRTTPAVPR